MASRQKMKFKLVQNNEQPERLAILIEATKITSAAKKQALYDHFVKGDPIVYAAALNGVKVQNLRTTIGRLNKLLTMHEKLKELDYKKFKNIS